MTWKREREREVKLWQRAPSSLPFSLPFYTLRNEGFLADLFFSLFAFDPNRESQTLYSMYSADLRASRCIVRFILSTFSCSSFSSLHLLRLERKKVGNWTGWRISRAFLRTSQPLLFIVGNKRKPFTSHKHPITHFTMIVNERTTKEPC